jgi:SET domain-containing protein
MRNLQNKDVIVKKARNGRGVFAMRDFESGEKILEVGGRFITGNVDEQIDEWVRDNSIRYDRNRYVVSPRGTAPDLLNHSCKPNARILKSGGAMYVAAIKPIANGDEITFDYSTILADDDIWEMECNCGEKSCRTRIKKFSSLPKRLREKYIALHIVPRYILAI